MLKIEGLGSQIFEVCGSKKLKEPTPEGEGS
jgi:hypothetical protein